MPTAVDGLKECSKCGETKPVSEYYKRKSSRDGLTARCKFCSSAACQRYYKINKKKIKQQRAIFHENNPEKKREWKKRSYWKHREKNRESERNYYQKNKASIALRKRAWLDAREAAVYKLENKVTNKIYIGQSTAYESRWAAHKLKMRKGIHINKAIQFDANKYGEASFEFSVIQEYPSDTSSDILLEHEQRLIDEYIAEGKELYNTNRDS